MTMNDVYKKYKDHPEVAMYVLYIREAHAGQMRFRDIAQPATFEERLHLARKACEESDIEIPILIDKMENTVKSQYGDLPNSALIIDKEGIIIDKQAWANPKKIDQKLTELLGGTTSAE